MQTLLMCTFDKVETANREKREKDSKSEKRKTNTISILHFT